MTDTNLAIFNDNKETLPAFALQDGNLGNDNVNTADIAMPQLKILQPLSPELELNPAGKSGMIFNTVTNEVFDSLYVINLDYKRQFSIFKKRELGGGYNGAFETKEAADAHASTLPGNIADYQIVETGVHYLLVLDAEGNPKTPAMMYFKGTALGASRIWNSNLVTESKGGPRFSTVWALTSDKNQNSKGTWWTGKATFAGFVTEGLYAAAKDQYQAIKGTVH